MNDIQSALKSEISSFGMTPPDYFEPGKLTRFPDNGSRNKNGWCTLYINPDGSAGAAFGNWKDINQKWFHQPDGKPLSIQQKQDFNRLIERAKKKSEQERKAKQAAAAKKAKEINPGKFLILLKAKQARIMSWLLINPFTKH